VATAIAKAPPADLGCGILSPEMIRWAAKQRITYLLGSALDANATYRDIYVP
jgi:hypothetical protein